MSHGKIAERGSFDDLIAQKGKFSHLIKTHLSVEESEKPNEETPKPQPKQEVNVEKSDQKKASLIVKEDRTTGNVGPDIYLAYMKYGGGIWIGNLI